MIKTYLGDRPDGSPQFDYAFEPEEVAGLEDGSLVQFLTGPVSGTFTMDDGTEYGVSDERILIAARHLDELHLAIHEHHHAQGRVLESPIPEDKYRSFLTDHVVHGGPGADVDPEWPTRLGELIADRTKDEIAASKARLAEKLAAQKQ